MILIVPLAGKDPQFKNNFKPFIQVGNVPLIKIILRQHDIRKVRKIIFITLKEHEKKYKVTLKLKSYFGKKAIVRTIPKVTQGAPISILNGISDLINTNEPVLIELADVMRDLSGLYKDIRFYLSSTDGIIPVEKKQIKNRKWGYVQESKNRVIVLKEKKSKTNLSLATMGLYFFSSGNIFLEGVRALIKNEKNKINGAYFVGSVYNELIRKGYRIRISKNKILDILSTPEDINTYGNFRASGNSKTIS